MNKAGGINEDRWPLCVSDIDVVSFTYALRQTSFTHLESWTGHFSLTSDFFKGIFSWFVVCLNNWKVD